MNIKEDLHEFVNKYMSIGDAERHAVVDYALSTWKPLPNNVKILHFVGGVGTGKSLALQAMQAICNKPVVGGHGTTDAALLHLLDEHNPCTLIVNDVDELILPEAEYDDGTGFQGHMKSILVSGTNSQTAYVMYPVANDVKASRCFGHKITAGMAPFSDPSLASRSLVVRLDHCMVYHFSDFEADAEMIREKLLALVAA